MSEEITKPEGTRIPPPARCLAQDQAGSLVHEYIQRRAEKMWKKGIAPIFAFELYAINCDRHADEGKPEASHIDLMTSPLEEMTPEGLVQVIRATEALLEGLKRRLT